MSFSTLNWSISVGCLALLMCQPSHASEAAAPHPAPSLLSYQPVLQNYRRFVSVTPLPWQQAMQNLREKPDEGHAQPTHHGHHQHAMPATKLETKSATEPAINATTNPHAGHQHGVKP